jgi:hypothetical protein
MLRDDAILLRRDRELTPRAGAKLRGDLIKIFNDIERGFQDQASRADAIMDYWDAYNCKLNSNQVYNGNANLYVPIVRMAVKARQTRFLNYLFPQSGRHITGITSDGPLPHAQLSLLEHYIRDRQVMTSVVGPLLRNGDLEGQYNLYIDWNRTERHTVSRETSQPKIDIPGLPGPVDMPEGEGEEQRIEDIRFDTVPDQGPDFEVLHDADIYIHPRTAKGIDDALRQGGSVTIIRRWTKHTLEDMMQRKEIARAPAETLLELSERQDILQESVKLPLDAAGIRYSGGGGSKYFQIYEVWQCLDDEFTKEGRRLCYSYYAGKDIVLTTRRNRFWNDRCPLLSEPVERVTGSVKGVAPVAAIDQTQYHANDIANQAADSATYSMLPIIMSDPAKNPRTSTMILNLAAIWEVDPNSTKFAEFPKLWQDGIALIQADTQLAFTVMGVNPAMLPQQTGRPGAKRNQAEVALEQTVDVMTTDIACSVVTEGIMTPLLHRCYEYDMQFRDEAITIKMFGDMGRLLKMEKVPPVQIGTRYHLEWAGAQISRNAMMNQQRIGWLNVARSMTPDLNKNGYALNPAPALEQSAGELFGWEIGRQILVDYRAQLTVPPAEEDALMMEGFWVPVHPLDQDPDHLKSHQLTLRATGDPTGVIRDHIQRHMAQMAAKTATMMRQQMQQQMQPGSSQGGAPGGQPQPGAMPQGPKLVRGAPGAIHRDQMPRAGAVPMPRRF